MDTGMQYVRRNNRIANFWINTGCMNSLELKVYEIFKTKLGEKEAEVVMEFINLKPAEKINEEKDIFLTKDDKVDIIKSIYMANIIQFIAIIASLLGILKLMK